MIKKLTLRLFILVLGMMFVGLIFNSNNNSGLIDSVLAAPKLPSNYSNFCGYDNVTSVFQANGMPSNSIIRDIERIDYYYFSLNIYNRITNRSEIYLYYLGNDLLLNTSDDRTFFVDFIPANGNHYVAPVLALSTGYIVNNTLYWVKTLQSGTREVKSCTVNSMGCVNPTVIFNFSSVSPIVLQAMTPSFVRERIYFVYRNVFLSANELMTSFYSSCSLQPNVSDSCNRGMGNFTMHSHHSYYFYKNVRAIGFVSTNPLDPNSPGLSIGEVTYFLDVNQPNSSFPTFVALPANLNLDSIMSLGNPGLIFAINKGFTSNDSLVIVNFYPMTSYEMDYLPSPVDWDPVTSLSRRGAAMIEIVNSTFEIAYKSSGNVIAKMLGGPEHKIYTPGPNEPEIFLKSILGDKSVLGFMSSRSTIVKFRCIP